MMLIIKRGFKKKHLFERMGIEGPHSENGCFFFYLDILETSVPTNLSFFAKKTLVIK